MTPQGRLLLNLLWLRWSLGPARSKEGFTNAGHCVGTLNRRYPRIELTRRTAPADRAAATLHPNHTKDGKRRVRAPPAGTTE